MKCNQKTDRTATSANFIGAFRLVAHSCRRVAMAWLAVAQIPVAVRRILLCPPEPLKCTYCRVSTCIRFRIHGIESFVAARERHLGFENPNVSLHGEVPVAEHCQDATRSSVFPPPSNRWASRLSRITIMCFALGVWGCSEMGKKYVTFTVTTDPPNASVDSVMKSKLSGNFNNAHLGRTPLGPITSHFAFGAPVQVTQNLGWWSSSGRMRPRK
jgi:hypothetical protein